MTATPRKTFTDVLSRERLRLWAEAKNAEPSDGRPELARRLIAALDCSDAGAQCEAVLGSCLTAHFYNMSASAKRRFFDGIAVALCDNPQDADQCFEMIKRAGWAGRTRSPG